jgi:hypothetical protein
MLNHVYIHDCAHTKPPILIIGAKFGRLICHQYSCHSNVRGLKCTRGSDLSFLTALPRPKPWICRSGLTNLSNDISSRAEELLSGGALAVKESKKRKRYVKRARELPKSTQERAGHFTSIWWIFTPSALQLLSKAGPDPLPGVEPHERPPQERAWRAFRQSCNAPANPSTYRHSGR